MHHLLTLLGGWYQAIWPNLAASAITFGLGMWWHRRSMHARFDHLHARLDVALGIHDDPDGGGDEPA